MPLFKCYILHYSFFYLSAVQNSQESLVVMTLQCLNAFCNNFFVTTSADGSADTLLHIQMAVSYKARYLSHFRLPIVVGPPANHSAVHFHPSSSISCCIWLPVAHRNVQGGCWQACFNCSPYFNSFLMLCYSNAVPTWVWLIFFLTKSNL